MGATSGSGVGAGDGVPTADVAAGVAPSSALTRASSSPERILSYSCCLSKKLLLKKKLLKAIENNFIKFGAEALETPSFEISENIGSFLAEDDANPMSDVFSFQDGEKSITLRYDLSSPLARFVAQNNQELPSIFKRYAIQNVFRNEKAGNGRYREFMQADFDIVGNVNSAQANAELCNLISSTLLDCGLKKKSIYA